MLSINGKLWSPLNLVLTILGLLATFSVATISFVKIWYIPDIIGLVLIIILLTAFYVQAIIAHNTLKKDIKDMSTVSPTAQSITTTIESGKLNATQTTVFRQD